MNIEKAEELFRTAYKKYLSDKHQQSTMLTMVGAIAFCTGFAFILFELRLHLEGASDLTYFLIGIILFIYGVIHFTWGMHTYWSDIKPPLRFIQKHIKKLCFNYSLSTDLSQVEREYYKALSNNVLTQEDICEFISEYGTFIPLFKRQTKPNQTKKGEQINEQIKTIFHPWRESRRANQKTI